MSTGSASCHFFPFESRQVVNVTVMQGMCHAVLNTFRITRTQIALGGNSPPSFEMDAPERTGMHTHFASHAGGLIHNHGPGFRIPLNSLRGTDLQAEGRFALLTGHGKNGSLIQIDMDPDIGVLTLESSGTPKRADPLTISAAQAPIRINEYDFHGELYLPEIHRLK
jgi:hypothetical protein